jgi:ketosteroid isomerase-like protein
MRRYVDDLKTADLDAFASSFTLDAELLEPGIDAIRGRDAIRAYFAKAQMAGQSVTMETSSLETYGHNAYQWGTYRDPSGSGRYVAAWRQDEDGRWRITRLLLQPSR